MKHSGAEPSSRLSVVLVNPVSYSERHRRNGHGGAVVWFAGFSGAGKSTLALALDRELFERRWQSFVLDGDIVRAGLCGDLGFDRAARTENLRRAAETAKLLAQSGVIAIASFISPYHDDRAQARRLMNGSGIPFLEAYLSTPLHVCEERDPKGLYARARRGLIDQFTGVSAPFEVPESADVTIDTSV